MAGSSRLNNGLPGQRANHTPRGFVRASYLGDPIARFTLDKMSTPEGRQQLYEVMKAWVKLEQKNVHLRMTGGSDEYT
jgi:hypothetical protein